MSDLFRAVLDELRAIREALVELRTIGADLVKTSRFQRGGYDGPFKRPKTITVGATPVEIHVGAADPTALLIECLGTGAEGDVLHVSDDRGAMAGGYTVSLASPISIGTGNPLRIIADRRQRMFASADVRQVGNDNDAAVARGTVQITVREGRL